MEEATGRPFGLATLSAKWRELKGKGKGGGERAESSNEDGEEDEEEGLEGPDDEPSLGDSVKGWRRDDDEDDPSHGGATQAPGDTIQRLQVAAA